MGAEKLNCLTADGMMTMGSSFSGNNGEYSCEYFPDVEYANYNGLIRKLQIIKPEKENQKFPLIVYVKGSSWLKQKVYKNIPKLSQIARYGFVIAQVEYRESPDGSCADKIADTKAAIRFMRKHAEEYSVDVDNVRLFGDSSGGHIALMSAMTDGMYNNGLYGDEREDVKCVAEYYGVTDVVSLIQDFYKTDEEDLKTYLNDTFFSGKCTGDVIEEANKISPIYNIPDDKKLPPVLIVHGDCDRVVGFDQSARFTRAMQEKHQKVYLYKIMGADHNVGIWGSERAKLLADFFNSYMRNK